jgi:hypothetical protein
MDKYGVIGALIVLLGGANSAMAAGSVVANDGTTKCTSYSSMAVDAAGTVTIADCNRGSTNAVFTVVAAATATTGTALPATVKRTINPGGLPGDDSLNLTSNVAGVFTPAMLNFWSADGLLKEKGADVNFSATGSATLSATIGSTTVASSSLITVSAPIAGQCPSNFTSVNLGTLPTGNGTTHYIPVGSGQFFKFKVPTDLVTGKGYSFTYETAVNGNFGLKESAVSTCAGDFTSIGMIGPCHGTAMWAGGEVIANATAACSVIPGNTYYLNIKPASGFAEGFVLMITNI